MNGLSNTSHFTKHGPCEKCGSKDNVAWYSNGTGFCFGCGAFYKSPTHWNLAADRGTTPSSSGDTGNKGTLRSPPHDIDCEFPHVVMEWIQQYELEAKDLIRHNVVWSPSREQLIFLFYGEGKDVVLWQARNFRKGTDHKHRFFTAGTPANVVAQYYSGKTTSTGVVVEDCVSGIKVAMSGEGHGIPAFSSTLSTDKIVRLSKMYDRVIVWLDGDKFSEAVKLSNRFKMLGVESRVLHTSFDPKCYNLFEMSTLLHE